jgi:hypothetical protein
VLPEFAVMEPAQQMCVVIQPIGGAQHLVKVMAVIPRRSFLLRPLADNAQLFPERAAGRGSAGVRLSGSKGRYVAWARGDHDAATGPSGAAGGFRPLRGDR